MRELSYSELPKCSGCGASSFAANPDGSPVCEYCFTPFTSPEQTCLECGTPYATNARRCVTCGADLLRPCLSCEALNPSALTHCLVCGQEIGILSSLFDRVTTRPGGWLDDVRQEATILKTEQTELADAQLAEMWEIEKRRREALARAQAERDRQQRVLFTLIGVIAALLIIAGLISLILQTAQGQSPVLYSPWRALLQ